MPIITPTCVPTAVADAWYHLVASLALTEHGEQALPPCCSILLVAELLVVVTAVFQELPR
jgi:hypothetical protein